MADRDRVGFRLPSALLIAVVFAAQAWAQQPGPPPEEQSELQVPDLPEPLDPAVAAILETNPSTPAELVEAAKILADLGRPDKGKELLQQVIAARLNRQQMAELVERFGSPMFLGMAARKDMLPEARQLADELLAAAQQAVRDPKRLEGLIRQLQAPSPEDRFLALAGLKEAHSAGVEALVNVLADPNRNAEHAHVLAALAQMGSPAVRSLLAIVEGADPQLTVPAIRTLAGMNAKGASIYLLRPYLLETTDPKVRAVAGAALGRLTGRVPGKREAVRVLTERAKDYFDRRQPIRGVIDGRVEMYQWDTKKRQCVAKSYSQQDAALRIAARLARDAYALARNDPEVRLLYLATMLEAAAYETGLDRPLPDGAGTAMAEAAGSGVAVNEDLLESAAAGGHVGAATAAARILGRLGTAEGLLRQGARPAPLVRATWHPDRRLRLAATDAIVRLQPVEPFPGASYVPQSLAFFAATGGTRRALVAGPVTASSRRFVGTLAAMGFDVDTAGTGRELVRLAVASPDYELALIDAAIERPTPELLLQQLRRDCRTADLRVGLTARSDHLQRAEQIARRDPMARAFSRPVTAEAVRWQVEQLASLAPRTFVGHAQRQRQAAEALDRLAELSGSGSVWYDLRRAEDAALVALYAPQLSTKAAAVLGNLNSAESQRALVELASRWTQPLEARKAAVTAFRRNTQEHGILLTTAQISRQYDRYNASEERDANTQRVLGLILDCIEAPTQPVKAKQNGEEKAEAGE